MEGNSNELLKQLEAENGGSIEYKTYALFLGGFGSQKEDLGGLLYAIENSLYFEDFERENSLINLFGKKKKYEKFKIDFPINEIASCQRVSLSSARKVLVKGKEGTPLPAPGISGKIFGRSVTQVLLKNGSGCYFELFNHKEFYYFLKGKGL